MQQIGLYIHFPWCLKKCPYCDFNSYPLRDALPEGAYLQALLQDLTQELKFFAGRVVDSIYLGGGTPSLFSPMIVSELLTFLGAHVLIAKDAEITIEANPGTIEFTKIMAWRMAGINRLSIGVQSFQDIKLKALGRIHNSDDALGALKIAQEAGFSNINADLMFGLPEQSKSDALCDLQTALLQNITHLSWYQLTLEPGTLFAKQPPKLPDEDEVWQIQESGQQFIQGMGFKQYEVSAYCKNNYQSKHNTNYWQFGDYIGVGAGAHGKITDSRGVVTRYNKIANPKLYLAYPKSYRAYTETIAPEKLIFEFMLNALRLYTKIPVKLFNARTGLNFGSIKSQLDTAKSRGLMDYNQDYFWTTVRGRDFLNDVLLIFC